MNLNPIMEGFYKSLLDYAGLTLQDDVIVQKNEKLGDFTLDDKHIALPYMELLKNPAGKAFFHLLNENYTSPETAMFNMFKNRLVLEINLRFTSLITSLIALASDVMLQQRIHSSALIELVTNVGETDHSVIEAFLGMVKASTKQNKEGYIVDIFLKKNGEVAGTPYAAIGKLNFRLFEEVKRALESPEKDYRVFGFKVRKKDLMTVYNVMLAVFKDIENKDAYSEGTDNKIFRYLNVLLKTSYIVSSRMNDIADMMDELKEPSLNVSEIRGNHDWVEPLGKLQSMATEIRIIPNQTDISVEAKRLVIDESKANVPPVQQPVNPVQNTTFNPAMIQQTQPIQQQVTTQQQPMPQQPQQLQQPQAMSPEDIIRARASGIMPNGMPNMAPGYPNGVMPNMPGMVQGYPNGVMPNMVNMMPNVPQGNPTPAWMAAEMMRTQMANNQMTPNVNMDPATMQQILLQQQLQQQMLQQQMQANQLNMNPNIALLQSNLGMLQNSMQPTGIQLNPMFMQRTGVQV